MSLFAISTTEDCVLHNRVFFHLNVGQNLRGDPVQVRGQYPLEPDGGEVPQDPQDEQGLPGARRQHRGPRPLPRGGRLRDRRDRRAGGLDQRQRGYTRPEFSTFGKRSMSLFLWPPGVLCLPRVEGDRRGPGDSPYPEGRAALVRADPRRAGPRDAGADADPGGAEVQPAAGLLLGRRGRTEEGATGAVSTLTNFYVYYEYSFGVVSLSLPSSV